MIASRFHSARRNKRWQVVTGSMLLVLFGCWVYSGFYVDGVAIGRSKGAVTLMTKPSGVLVGAYRAYVPTGVWHMKISKKPDHFVATPLDRYFDIPRFRGNLGREWEASLPYWVIGLLILTVQYLFLPKSLPVMEEK